MQWRSAAITGDTDRERETSARPVAPTLQPMTDQRGHAAMQHHSWFVWPRVSKINVPADVAAYNYEPSRAERSGAGRVRSSDPVCRCRCKIARGNKNTAVIYYPAGISRQKQRRGYICGLFPSKVSGPRGPDSANAGSNDFAAIERAGQVFLRLKFFESLGYIK